MVLRRQRMGFLVVNTTKYHESLDGYSMFRENDKTG